MEGPGRQHAAPPRSADAQPSRTYSPDIEWDPEVQQYLESAFGAAKLAAMSAALARPPLATCLRVNTLRTTPQDLLRRLPALLTPEDRELLQQRPAYVHPQLPDAIILPGSGPHAIDYTPCGDREVVLGRKAGEAVMRGAHVFVPGLLAVSAGISRGDLVAVSVGLELPGSDSYAYTRGTVLGSEHEERQVASLGGHAPDRSRLFIGIGRAELSRAEFFQERGGVAFTMLERVFRAPGCGDVLPGEFMLQNLCSLVAAHVLAPPPGARVLDMCAAPGGKTTALAQLMEDKGEVVAFDRTHVKAASVRKLAESFGLTCVKAYKMDATRSVLPAEADGDAAAETAAGRSQSSGQPPSVGRRGGATEPPSATTLRRLERIARARAQRGLEASPSAHVESGKEATTPAFPPESFDYILCDAPCTALGLRPRLLHRQSLRELDQTAAYQRKLLRCAVALLRPGGALLFSTCSINPGENEANVRWLLDTFPCMRLVPQTPRLGDPGLTGSVARPGGGTQRLLTKAEAALVQRFDPSAPLDTTGFFVAKFAKAAA